MEIDDKVVVHHINEDESDDRPQNLVALTIQDHLYIHNQMRGLRKTEILDNLCEKCKEKMDHVLSIDRRVRLEKLRFNRKQAESILLKY